MAMQMRAVMFTTVFLAQLSAAVAQPTTLNDKVVQFCKAKLGEKVGDGECSSLADAALSHAGAKPRPAFKEAPNNGDYVWGKLVYTLEMNGNSREEKKVSKTQVKPGDVIQLRDVKFQAANYSMNYHHHTAVVLNVRDGGKVWGILEQNYGGKRFVTERTYRLNDLKTGWIRVYRPVAK